MGMRLLASWNIEADSRKASSWQKQKVSHQPMPLPLKGGRSPPFSVDSLLFCRDNVVTGIKRAWPRPVNCPNLAVADWGRGFRNHPSQNHLAISAAESRKEHRSIYYSTKRHQTVQVRHRTGVR